MEQLDKWEEEDLLENPTERNEHSESHDDENEASDDLASRRGGKSHAGAADSAKGETLSTEGDNEVSSKKKANKDITFGKIIGGEFLTSNF